MKNLFKKSTSGFTLAEVLVTLGIIGVVAALTMPTLISNHQHKVYVTQLHKVYNVFTEAVERYVNDHNAIDLKETPMYNNADELRNFVTSYFKVVNDCGTRYAPCFAPEYKYMNGTVQSVKNGQCNMVFTIASGASICADVARMEDVESEDGETITSANQTNTRGNVLDLEIDINGVKGPNIYGRDFFFVSLDRQGNFFDGYDRDTFTTNKKDVFWGKIVDDGWKMEY